jgi:2-(1,2-epoxy-1,2-dihydrophenyl)acetyl-CoA isomerase
MAEQGVLIVEKEGPVSIVTLNRPEVFNAFNGELRTKLREAIEETNADAQTRVAVIRGSGPGFCAGADLKEGLDGSVTEQIEREYKPFLMAIAESPKLWIASIHGSAAGIGGALAMACDLAVMDAKSNIYLAFAAIGLIPDGGATWHLVRAMGRKRAIETIVEGGKISAEECLRHGLANRIAAEGQAFPVALQWAQELSAGAPLAQAAAKKAINAAIGLSLAETISLEAQLQYGLTQSKDFRDGVAAFFEKRKPVFSGR